MAAQRSEGDSPKFEEWAARRQPPPDELFEDEKDTIKLTSLVSNVVDADTQEKIDIVKSRLIRDFGYNDESATDVLQYVASIFARGDTRAES